MSLSSAASIARSSLNAVAAEASVVSRNITGASDTAIYSRKVVNRSTGLYGVEVVSVTRAANRAVFDNVLGSTAAAAAQEALAAGLEALNRTVGDVASDGGTIGSEASSPAALLSNFTDALQSYAGAPSDPSFSGEAVTAAKTLAVALNSAATIVQKTRSRADGEIAASVKTVNSLLSQFQIVNTEIVAATAAGAGVADAQDARDNILAKLAAEVGITTSLSRNNDMSIYTDGGVTLFQGGAARQVTFAPTDTFTAATIGAAVYIDGVPVTGGAAAMPIVSGAVAGNAKMRDDVSVTYQSQLDEIANGLIESLSESDPTGGGQTLAGLFATPGSSSLPASLTGLASMIEVNPSFDLAKGGDPVRLRDGDNYNYNTNGQAGFSDRLMRLLATLSAPQSFSSAGGIGTSGTLAELAADSVSWLAGERSSASSASSYQNTLLEAATTALSNETGVNIDDELAKMLDLEQSYAASAKLVTTINSMFQVLLTASGNH